MKIPPPSAAVTATRRCLLLLLALLLPLLALAAGCEFADDLPELGTPGNPVVITFVESTKEAGQIGYAKQLVDGVARRTGLTIIHDVKKDAAVVQGFGTGEVQVAVGVGPNPYAESYERGGRIRLCAVRHGLKHYQAMIISHVDSGIETLPDCNNRVFGFPSTTSTSGYVFPMMAFQAAKVTIAEERSLGQHDAVIGEVYNRAIDIGASFWSPPQVIEPPGIDMTGYEVDVETGNVRLTNGMTVTWDKRLLDPSGRELVNAVVEMWDARRGKQDAYPDVFRKVRIVRMTPPIPNDGVVFHANLPSRVVMKLVNALKAYSRTAEGQTVLGKMYTINALDDTSDEEYAAFRAQVKGH